MKHKNIPASENTSQTKNARYDKSQSSQFAPLTWWYGLVTPPDPPETASHAQRETIRHARLASLAVLLFMLFLLFLIEQQLAVHNFTEVLQLLIQECLCVVTLLLNRKGWVNVAGVLFLIITYMGLLAGVLGIPDGLTLSTIYRLDFTIIPDLVALAFFSSSILFLVTCINSALVWSIITYAPHDKAVDHILQTDPSQFFSHIYALLLITAAVLYLWSYSAERAIMRADRAEEIAAFERREKELKEKELEQKRQLDTGIQQILQTQVAVANGDLSARAPLGQDHILWQVAGALNNLIARLQRLNYLEQKLKHHSLDDNKPTMNEPITNQHESYGQNKIMHPRLPHHTNDESKPITDKHESYEQNKITHPRIPKISHDPGLKG